MQIKISENEPKDILGNDIVDIPKAAEELIGNIIERCFHATYFNTEYLKNVKEDKI